MSSDAHNCRSSSIISIELGSVGNKIYVYLEAHICISNNIFSTALGYVYNKVLVCSEAENCISSNVEICVWLDIHAMLVKAICIFNTRLYYKGIMAMAPTVYIIYSYIIYLSYILSSPIPVSFVATVNAMFISKLSFSL